MSHIEMRNKRVATYVHIAFQAFRGMVTQEIDRKEGLQMLEIANDGLQLEGYKLAVVAKGMSVVAYKERS